VVFSLPGEQRKTLWLFPIGSAKTKWLFGAWNASRDQSPADQIIQGVVPGRCTRSLLTNKAVQSLSINQGPTLLLLLFFLAHQHKATGRKTRLDIQNYGCSGNLLCYHGVVERNRISSLQSHGRALEKECCLLGVFCDSGDTPANLV